MASIQRHGKRWRVQLYVGGKRVSAVLDTKREAAAWALQREAELSGAKLPDKTMADAMTRYSREVAPSKRGERWEVIRLKALAKAPIARIRMAALNKADVTDWRDARLGEVSGATVAREMTLLRAVFEAARRDWGWLTVNPMQGVRWPKPPASRKRRVTADEIERVGLALGVDGMASDRVSQRVGLSFLFALETAMRAGEILALHWPDVHLAQRYVHLPETKNGEARDVPLTKRAAEIINALPRGDGPVFNITSAQRDALFRKARNKAGIPDLHYHDSRAEAIWRLSKKLDVLQLARVIGHRDPKSLLMYYSESAAEMATRLD